MTTRYSYVSQCLGKKGYQSYRWATKAARALARKEKEAFHVYRCVPYCGRWHVGHAQSEQAGWR